MSDLQRAENEKEIKYAYATSDSAREHGHYDGGCWIVEGPGVCQAFATDDGHDALTLFKSIEAPIYRWSYFGECDIEDAVVRENRIGKYNACYCCGKPLINFNGVPGCPPCNYIELNAVGSVAGKDVCTVTVKVVES